MLASHSGFQIRVEQIVPDVITNYYMIHREALAAITLSSYFIPDDDDAAQEDFNKLSNNSGAKDMFSRVNFPPFEFHAHSRVTLKCHGFFLSY